MTQSTLLRLTWNEKKKFQTSSTEEDEKVGKNIAQLVRWAHDELGIRNVSAYSTMIWKIQQKELVDLECSAGQGHKKMIEQLQNYELEIHLSEWVYKMWSRTVLLIDGIIQANARKLFHELCPTQQLNCYGSHFSNGWLYQFRKRYNFRSYNSHGESVDAGYNDAERVIPLVRALVRMHGESNVVNAD